MKQRDQDAGRYFCVEREFCCQKVRGLTAKHCTGVKIYLLY